MPDNLETSCVYCDGSTIRNVHCSKLLGKPCLKTCEARYAACCVFT